MQIILLSGQSGSGKSIALKALEDLGCNVVDNLPIFLLPQLIEHMYENRVDKVAIAIDIRVGMDISTLPEQIANIRQLNYHPKLIFLTSREDVLIERYSETRRRHPLVNSGCALAEAIQLENELLSPLRELSFCIDTTQMLPRDLQVAIRDFCQLDAFEGLTLLLESFGFKYGLPMDADLVFDARCLPNPYYDLAMRKMSGKDKSVIEFLQDNVQVIGFIEDTYQYIYKWLPTYIQSGRSYITVGIGCTGGQHRSVYIAEQLKKYFIKVPKLQVLLRHRNLKE